MNAFWCKLLLVASVRGDWYCGWLWFSDCEKSTTISSENKKSTTIATPTVEEVVAEDQVNKVLTKEEEPGSGAAETARSRVPVTNPVTIHVVSNAAMALDQWNAPLALTVITELNEKPDLRREVEKIAVWPECFARLNVLVGISVENPPPPPKNVVNTVVPALKPSVLRIVKACEKREPAAVTAALKSIPHREMDKIVMVPECQKLMATALGFAQKPLKHLKMTLNLKLNVTVNIGNTGYGSDGSAINDPLSMEQLINGNSFSGALLETLAFYWVAVFAF